MAADHLPHPLPYSTPSQTNPAAPWPLRGAGIEEAASGALTIGLKRWTHDWLQKETFLFLDLDQLKPFIFISDSLSFFFVNLRLGIWLPWKLSELWCFI